MPTTQTKARGRHGEKAGLAHSARNEKKPSASSPVKQSGKSDIAKAIESLDKTKADAAKRAGTTPDRLTKLPAKQQGALAKGDGFQMLATVKLGRSPFNRETFDARREAEMKESVREHGILQPLTVRRNPKYRALEQNGVWRVTTIEGTPVTGARAQHDAQYLAAELNEPEYEIIAGERRWRAATALHLAEVPVIIRGSSDREAVELQAIENLQREDLNHIDEATKYQQLVEIYKQEGIFATEAVEMVGANLNVSKSLVYDRLRLINLPESTKQAALSGILPGSHASLIAKIDDRDLQEEVTKRVLKPSDHELPDEDDEPHGETIVSKVCVMSFRATNQIVNEAIETLKNRREYNTVKDQFIKDGLQVLPAEVNLDLFEYEHSRSIDGKKPYVCADQWCSADHRGRNWKEALGKLAPPEILSQNRRGKAMIVYERPAAEAAMRKKNGSKSSTKSTRPESELRKEREHKARSKAFIDLLGPVATAGENMDGPEIWRVIFDHIRSIGSSDAIWRVAKRRFPELKKDEHHKEFPLRFKDASGKVLRGVVMEILFSYYAPSTYASGWGNRFVDECKLLGIDAPDWKVQTSGNGEEHI